MFIDLDEAKTNLTGLYEMLIEMSKKLDRNVEDLEETKQKLLKAEKELNATKAKLETTKQNKLDSGDFNYLN